MITAAAVEPLTRDGARAAARRELSKAVYHRYDDPWPVALAKAVGRWLNHVFSTAAAHSPGGAAGVIALVAVAIAVVAVVRWRLGPVRRTARRPGTILDEHVTTSADHLREAERHAAAGRWAEAVVARMRALARELEERGVLDVRPGRTAEELASEVGGQWPDTTAALRAAAMAFDAVAYGRRPAGPATYDTVRVAQDAVTARRTPAGARG